MAWNVPQASRKPGSMVETAKSPSQQSPLRLGIIGTGFIGQFHARNAMGSAAVELAAVASARGAETARRLAGELGPSVRALSIEALLKDPGVEAVLLATRTTDHARHAVAVVAIDYGRRVGTVQLSRTSRVGLEMRFEVVGSEGSALLTEQRLGGGITVWTASRAHEFPPDCRAAFPDAYPREQRTSRRAAGATPSRAPRSATTAGRSRPRWRPAPVPLARRRSRSDPTGADPRPPSAGVCGQIGAELDIRPPGRS
jgi:GFO/IDH/MocA oxidoreductase family protein